MYRPMLDLVKVFVLSSLKGDQDDSLWDL